MLTKNGNYLIVNRLLSRSLSFSLPPFLSLSLPLPLPLTPSVFFPRRLHCPLTAISLHPLTWYTHLAAIMIHTGRLLPLVADGEQEEKRRCAVSAMSGGEAGWCERWMSLGYSADSRATVHTPKRVFVRFHFTPNYLVHTRKGTGEETSAKGRKRERSRDREREKE